MKNCPKCYGKGMILNYTTIDGGICYECSGKGLVSDNHKMYSKPKTPVVPEWVKANEKKVMQESHNKMCDIISQVHEIIGGKKGLAREVFEMMESKDQKHLGTLRDEEFSTFVKSYYANNLQDLQSYCPEYFK